MSGARLARLRRRARLVLTAEAVLIAALRPAGVVALFLIVCLTGFGGWRADLIALIAFVIMVWLAIRDYHGPTRRAIDRRIERDSRLQHRPIAALEDHPANTGNSGLKLWDAHRIRLERTLAGARVGMPAPDFAARDPYALRILLLLALIAAWIAAGTDAGSRLAASLRMPALFTGAGIGVQAWITPPRWDGGAPRLVDAGPKPIHVLRGATLSLIVTNAGASAPAATLAGRGLGFATIGHGSYRTHLRLKTGGTLVIGPFWHRIARYRIAVITPTPPAIAFARPPQPDKDGRRVDLAWQGQSRYGLKGLDLHLAPAGSTSDFIDSIALPARQTEGGGIDGKARINLLSSPYAGMTVNAVLAATNRRGQTGTSTPASLNLPAPTLHNRTAQAIETVRRDLALNRAGRAVIGDRLKAIAAQPPGPVTADTRKAIASFAATFPSHAPAKAHAEAALWTLVQRAEQGARYEASRKLEAARKALDRALRQAEAGHSPSARKFRHVMTQLHQAMQATLNAEANENHHDRSSQHQRMGAINRLAGTIAHELAAGQTQQATQDMKRLQQMLAQLQHESSQSAAQRARQQAAQRAGDHLSRIMRREASLMNRTSRRSRTPQPGNHAAQQPDQASHSLAQQQHALQRALAAAAQSMQSSGLQTLPQLGQGQSAMEGAHGHLQRGDLAGAVPAERAAIQALQQAQNALEAMRGDQGQGGGPSGLGEQAAGGQGEYGNQNQSSVSLGHAGMHSDARRLQGELIRRDAQPDLPAPAHRYYRRLLGKGS